MKSQIQNNEDSIKIEISDTEGNGNDLLKEFEKCQKGTCSCPTSEYSKLDAMDIEQSKGKVTLRLKPKKGQSFDVTEIEKCLDHTEKLTSSSK